MPLRGSNPVCLRCETEESPIWTNAENLGAICLNCINEAKDSEKNEEIDNKPGLVGNFKRKTRSFKSNKVNKKEVKSQKVPVQKVIGTKGRGRRVINKKTPIKAPNSVSTPVSGNSVYYKNFYYQKGDIVSLMDEDDDIYYAQLRGFLTDQYCEKSAVITWLLPTQESPPPKKAFDPATYIIGPDEEVPRHLDCMEFVMHAPSDYYKCRTTPYPTVYPTAKPGFIWTSLEPIQHILIGNENE